MRDTTEAPGLREYIEVLKARKWTVILVTLLVVGSAMYLSFQQVPIYEATSRLLVRPVETDPSDAGQVVNLDTESQLVSSEPVALLVIEELELEDPPSELLSRLTVGAATAEGDVLSITYRSTDPEVAAAAANSFAENYIEYVRAEALDVLESAQATIQTRIDRVRDRLAEVSEEAETARAQGNPTLVSLLETERGVLIARLGVLEQRLDDLPVTSSVRLGGGAIIEDATTPTSPSSPNHVRNGVFAVVLGLSLGLGLAFLKERLDDRFRGRPDIERITEAPVLAAVPRFRRQKKKEQPNPILLRDPQSGASEAYRNLRTNVEFILSQRDAKTIVVTSPSAGEGKTVTTANLGVAFAQMGRKVLMISADLRRPQLERYFSLDGTSGLSTFLAGQIAFQDLSPWIQQGPVPNACLIPSGPIPPNPGELLASPHLTDLVKNMESEFDIVLFDSPPTLPVSDAAVLAARIGNVVLVLDADKTHRSAALRAKQELQAVGATIVGSVLNAVEPRASRYSSDYYYSAAYSPSRAERRAASNGRLFGKRRRRREQSKESVRGS